VHLDFSSLDFSSLDVSSLDFSNRSVGMSIETTASSHLITMMMKFGCGSEQLENKTPCGKNHLESR
jgi:hypothetical protein